MILRKEVLRFLNNSYKYEPLNDFLKSIDKNLDLSALLITLQEMGDHYSPNKAISLTGEYNLLGRRFTQKGDDRMWSYGQQEGELGTLDNCQIFARITAVGREELRQFEVEESIKSVNISVIKTNRFTLLIAALAALFSILSFFTSILKSDEIHIKQLQETNSILQKQLQITDSLILNRIVVDSAGHVMYRKNF